MSQPPRSEELLGFLTVIDHNQYGLIGGYLVLNVLGRPIEFHITLPIQPTRAQKILYGDSLKPFLYGEQIGQTLLARSKAETRFVLTDTAPILSLQEMTERPIIYVFDDTNSKEPTNETDVEPSERHLKPDFDVSRWNETNIGNRTVAIPVLADSPSDSLLEQMRHLSRNIDLTEPFIRIRLAIEEAQRAA